MCVCELCYVVLRENEKERGRNTHTQTDAKSPLTFDPHPYEPLPMALVTEHLFRRNSRKDPVDSL